MRRDARRWVCLAAVILALGSCDSGDSLTPDDPVDAGELVAKALDMHTVQVRWGAVSGAGTYELERRADLEGPFAVVASGLSRGQTTYLDRNLDPGTIYGYRIRALDTFGKVIATTTVAGARTPPVPGIFVTTTSQGDSESVDADGYQVVVTKDGVTQTLPIDPTGTQLFSPLESGAYSVTLQGLAPQCELTGDPIQSAVVTDQGLHTVDSVRYAVRCRNPHRGRVTVTVTASGDTTDLNGFKLTLSGIASDASLPDNERATVISQTIGGLGGSTVFNDIRPGSYSIRIEDVAAYCTVTPSSRQRDGIAVEPLGDLTADFEVDCTGPGGGGGNRPFVFRQVWDADTSPPGSTVILTGTADLRAMPAEQLGAFQLEVTAAPSVVRFDSVQPGAGFTIVSNYTAGTGVAAIQGFNLGNPKGLVELYRAFYTVTGTNGQTTTTQTKNLLIGRPDASQIDTLFSKVEAKLVVGPRLSGGGQNQLPVAKANGPYSGVAGVPITLRSDGSTDPDGSIASYDWDFGDGTPHGATANPQHSYASAGTYNARLTVTDNRGATASDVAQVTITAGGTSGTPFVWTAAFGPVGSVDSMVTLTLSLDLHTDIPETPGVEALGTWSVTSLHFDQTMLRYFIVSFPNGTGGLDASQAASQGKLLNLRGTITGQSTGVIPLATIRFRVLPSGGGKTMSTETVLGDLIATASNGSFNYKPLTKVVEASLTLDAPPPPSALGTVNGTIGFASGSSTPSLTGVSVKIGSTSAGTVTVHPDAAGAYSSAAVPVGTGAEAGKGTVTITNLPAGCTSASTTVSYSGLTEGGTVTAPPLTLTCSAPPAVGTIKGSIAFATGSPTPSLSAVSVRVAPAASGTSPVTVNPTGQGLYTASNVAVGTGAGAGAGTVTVSNLPTGCTAASSTVNYTGLTAGGSVTAPAITVNCSTEPEPALYQFYSEWGAVSGGKVTVTLKIDMTTRNDPQNNGTGPDAIGAYQLTLHYPAARLSNPSCQGGQLTGVFNADNPEQIVIGGFTTSKVTGANIVLATCTFDAQAGPAATPAVTDVMFGDTDGHEFTAFVKLNLGVLP